MERVLESPGKRILESWKTLEFGLCKSWKVLEKIAFLCLYEPWIKPVSDVHPSVRHPSICFTKSFFNFNEIWHVGRGRWVMHDGMQYDPMQGQGQAHKHFRVGNSVVFKSCLRHLQRELATDHGFLNKGTISKFDPARFLIFGLIFVSCDFEVGTNVSCKESILYGANLFLCYRQIWFYIYKTSILLPDTQ